MVKHKAACFLGPIFRLIQYDSYGSDRNLLQRADSWGGSWVGSLRPSQIYSVEIIALAQCQEPKEPGNVVRAESNWETAIFCIFVYQIISVYRFKCAKWFQICTQAYIGSYSIHSITSRSIVYPYLTRHRWNPKDRPFPSEIQCSVCVVWCNLWGHLSCLLVDNSFWGSIPI